MRFKGLRPKKLESSSKRQYVCSTTSVLFLHFFQIMLSEQKQTFYKTYLLIFIVKKIASRLGCDCIWSQSPYLKLCLSIILLWGSKAFLWYFLWEISWLFFILFKVCYFKYKNWMCHCDIRIPHTISTLAPNRWVTNDENGSFSYLKMARWFTKH